MIENIINFVFPPICPCCGRIVVHPHHLCPPCKEKVEVIKTFSCSICGIPVLGSNHICGVCLIKRPAYDNGRSIFIYKTVIRDLIQAFKYRRDICALAVITHLCTNIDLEDFSACDYIIPVPLHKERLRFRGYNQSNFLAKYLFPYHKNKIRNDILLRIRNTKTQTGLTGAERRKNIKQAFRVSFTRDVIGRTFCLIDDVFTTGTTVNECASCLVQAGARKVLVLTLARVDIT
ncbi:MAG: ComF family protein [Desulfotalea sp.]